MIRIITVGKKNQPHIETAVKDYQKRLQKPFITEWVHIPNSPKNAPEAVLDESQRILKAVNTQDYVILLDEHGKNLSSPELSSLITKQLGLSNPIAFIIGGAYGVSQDIKTRANFTWSLSNLVFPHQLVRLILAEQLYRAQQIHLNHPYHHQ